ncbi:hypothetical protein GCM10010910_17430 [Microbacterium nanhaiense]|uniref:DUF998 domain-containing protein n=2 Tax=Microbacterium nanhaiense TaxID=1301026 RepID=A0ABQ2N2U3_9MICO|nr:hypothetical protein GCM10010910_17430 [Microbacterium nanhaiense]
MWQEMRALLVTIGCFVLGTAAGCLVLWGDPRPLAGDGSLGMPAALVAGGVAAAAFIVSTLLYRRGETSPMPRWQSLVSNASAVALTIVFAGVTSLGVLLGGEVLALGLQGANIPPLGGGLIAGVAAAIGGRFAFAAGVGITTEDLAALLFGYLVVGTLFAMLTAADARWWELNFSQLGSGARGWAFNGTLVVAGLLVATVGSFVGRDIHRLRGDAVLGRIAALVGLWVLTGAALACVGLFPLANTPTAHHVSALATLVLFAASSAMTTLAIPGWPAPLVLVTVGVGALLAGAVVLWKPVGLYSLTVLEVVVVTVGLLWMTTLVRVLAALTPSDSRPSGRRHLLHPAHESAAMDPRRPAAAANPSA